MLTAINRKDGRTLWTHVTGGAVTADLAVVAETVIASSQDGYVYALGPAERNPNESDGSHV
jgi:outer membrane protein assembly factor BamB